MAIGACLKIVYSGSAASCLVVVDATAGTITSKIGGLGSEVADTAFGTAGVISLTAQNADTLDELQALVDGYTDYTALVLSGGEVASGNLASVSSQAKGTGAFLFGSALSTVSLTSWERAQLYLGLPDSDQTMIEYLINSASETAEDVAKRRLRARAYTKDVDGPGRPKLVLPDYPVHSITSIYEDSSRTFGATTEVTSDDYALYTDAGIVKRLGSSWAEGDQNIRITYNAGLTPVPSRLQDAVLEVVAWNLKRFRGSGIGIRSISAPDGVNTAMELLIPLSAKQTFESYKDGRL